MRRLSALMLALPLMAAIDGTVMNRTTGKPQAGATVTLYDLGKDGMESIESVKSDAQGKFQITKTGQPQGPRLIQAAFSGVTYNLMLPPGSPATGLMAEVYAASKQPGGAKLGEHMVLFEPTSKEMMVSESFVFRNGGTTTYNDPEGGTLKFYLPPAAKGIVQVSAVGPQSLPVQRPAEKTDRANVYKLDFPIKPGETRIDLTYLVPYVPPLAFEGKLLYPGSRSMLIAPVGVEIKGDGLTSKGTEPRTQASLFEAAGGGYKVQIAGSGSLRAAGASSGEEEGGGPSMQQIMPRVHEKAPYVLALAFAILALGFVLLYRAKTEDARADALPKEKNERRRR